MENKRGFTSLTLLLVIILSFMVMLILGFTIFAADIFDDTFSQIEIDFGNNITFNETYKETLQPALVSMKTTVPKLISTGILLGMLIAMMLVAYNTENIGRLWLIFDIGIIIIAEMAAVLIKSSFISFMNSTPEFLQIFSTTLSLGSKYILNLPIIVPTLGAILMVVTHIIGKKKEEEIRF